MIKLPESTRNIMYEVTSIAWRETREAVNPEMYFIMINNVWHDLRTLAQSTTECIIDATYDEAE